MSEVFDALAAVTAETFEPHLGATYRVSDGTGESLEVVLVELTRRPGGPSGGRKPFSVVFRGPRDIAMSQGTYRFEAPDGGELLFFVVPIGPAKQGDGLLYEAIFN